MNFHPKDKKWVVYLSTFPPRECGIATFTEDLMDAFDKMYNPREEAKVIAMNFDELSQYNYDEKRVIFEIPQPDSQSYLKAAEYLNKQPQVTLVNVQHEFGIFGGPYGSNLLLFLKKLTKPSVITFHTVLPGPNPELRETVVALNSRVSSIVVMTETSKKILLADYGIEESRIKVIPHGIHSTDFTDGRESKKRLNLSKRTVISTFGLLNRGKGIEHGIEAMAGVVKKIPNAVYLIIGATHPVVLKNEGEEYRNKLIQRVRDLKLEKNVLFYNRYFSVPELLKFLDATDIYLSLSQNPNQAVSGTLTYALGCGRPVVSTAFAQAKEDVPPEMGVLVGFDNPKEIENAVVSLAEDPKRRLELGRNAYFRSRGRTWPNVLISYMKEFIRIAPSLGKTEKNMPKISLEHIIRMTDDFGMIQFAKMTSPDPASGYTTDDNCRALVALTRYYEKSGRKKALPLIQTYISFLEQVEWSGGFHNYVDINKKIVPDQHERENLESMNSRVMFALSKAAASPSLPEAVKKRASALFKRKIWLAEKAAAPRSIAYHIKAMASWKAIDPETSLLIVTRLADKLCAFYEENSGPQWKWFEEIMAYSNGVLPDSLLDAYTLTKNPKYLAIAHEAIDFLVENSFEGEVCMPIGQSGWLRRGGKKYLHDQQPEEVAVLVMTLKSIYRITRDEKYKKRMMDAFSWFLGNNSLQQVVYNQATGGCYDGLGERYINLNQGAESTVMYLLARLAFE